MREGSVTKNRLSAILQPRQVKVGHGPTLRPCALCVDGIDSHSGAARWLDSQVTGHVFGLCDAHLLLFSETGHVRENDPT